MSAMESGATMTQSTGEPEVDGRSDGANGAARPASGACRAGRGGSAQADAERPITAAKDATTTGAARIIRRRLELRLMFWIEVPGSNQVRAAAPGQEVGPLTTPKR